MRTKMWTLKQVIGLLIAGLMVGSMAQAQTLPSGGPFVMKKSVIAGGGGRATGGAYDLVGTIGQHEASPPSNNSSPPYVLQGGFHTMQTPSTPQPDELFKNGFEN